MRKEIQVLFDEQTEMALLGAFLINPENLIMSTLRSEDFSNKSLGELFKVMREMADTHMEIDVSTVFSELKKRNITTWTKPDLYALTTACSSSMHWESYEIIIRDLSARRSVVAASTNLYNAAIDTEKPLSESISKTIESISESAGIQESAIHVSDWLEEFEDDIIQRAMGENESGLKTGFKNLDEILGGLEPKTMMLIMGVPAVGKSMFTMQVGLQMAANYPGAIYSLEMQGKSVIRRMISGMGRISAGSLKSGRMTEEEQARYDSTVKMIEKRRLYLSDFANWDLFSLRSELTKQKVNNGIRWFVLDYMYLMSDEIQQDEIRRTTTISTGLKKICSDLNLVGIIVHSLNKGGFEDGAIPSMKNVRGSGQVVYNADIILALSEVTRDLGTINGLDTLSESQRRNIRALWVLKGRELQYTKQYALFTKMPDYPLFTEFK